MRDVIIAIFGEYEPVVVDGVAVSGMAGVDWTYISEVLLFGIVLFCFFKIVGAVIKLI